MFLDILTPDDTIFSGEVKLIQLPGTTGSFEILEGHAPLISSLKKGKVKIVDANNQKRFYEIKGGVIEVLNNKVILLAQ